MIDHDNVGLALLTALALVAVAATAWEAHRGVSEYRAFRAFTDSEDRVRTYRLWFARSLTLFGGLAVLMVIAAWTSIGPLRDAATTFPRVTSYRRMLDETDPSTIAGMIVGAGLGLAVAIGLPLAVKRLRAARSGATPRPAARSSLAPDVEALIPRTPRETRYGALLSINAGVSEELFFRVGLPAVLYAVTGNAVVAFGLSIVAFGFAHRYQGWAGVVGTGLFGWVMTVLYVASGSIVLPIVVHTLIDLRVLVLVPLLRRHRASRPKQRAPRSDESQLTR